MRWLQAGLACAIAGTFVPGLGPAARLVPLAALLIAAAAGLESAWTRTIAAAPAASSSPRSRSS